MKFTQKQGQYLAFIYNYTKIHVRPPAEADMQRYFRVTRTICTSDGSHSGEERTYHPSPRTSPINPVASSERGNPTAGVNKLPQPQRPQREIMFRNSVNSLVF